MYTIARMDDEGRWVALETFDSYSEAEMDYDKYEEMYPYALIEIISHGE
jgi:hypothetical protein